HATVLRPSISISRNAPSPSPALTIPLVPGFFPRNLALLMRFVTLPRNWDSISTALHRHLTSLTIPQKPPALACGFLGQTPTPSDGCATLSTSERFLTPTFAMKTFARAI